MMARANRNTKHCVSEQDVCWKAYFCMFTCLLYALLVYYMRNIFCVCVRVCVCVLP